MTAENSRARVPVTRMYLCAAVLATGLGVAWQTGQVIERQQQARFDQEVSRIESAIEQRIGAYMQIMRGGRGMFEASSEVTRDDWHTYVERQQLNANYPGIRAMTFVPIVEPDELQAFLETVRLESSNRFTNPDILKRFELRAPPPPIVPSEPTTHAPVLYTEPLTADSERALGIDLMRDQVRRQSLEAAVASDDAVISPRLRVLRSQGTQVGFIAFLPVYREARHLGWLTATFHARAFMDGLLGDVALPIMFELFDGIRADPTTLIYSTAGIDSEGTPIALVETPSAFETVRPLAMPGRVWTAHFTAGPGFTSITEELVPWLVAGGGLLASLLLYVLSRAGAQWQGQAALLARQATALTEARAAADAANSAKSLFLASMSHEIRTPLNAILGTAELLADTPLSSGQKRSLATITQSGDHLLGVINDILDFTKVEAGMLELDDAIFDLHAVVHAAINLVAQRAADKGLELSSGFATGTPVTVRGDAGRVRQILVNYLVNAIKFTEIGSVTVAVSSTPIDEGRHRIRIAVHDTGIGIPADRQDRLFRSFSQVDAATTRRYGGTGLGLAICKRFAEHMGGEVGVDSAAGQGSTFYFTFVAAVGEALPVRSSPTLPPDQPLPPLRILLVEDNLLNQEVGQRMLESLGQLAELARNGVEAVAAVRRQTYDLLLMDVHMPEMDGLEATRQIRALPHITQPRILAMSASVLDDERQACLDAGMNRHLAKPFRRAELEEALREVARDCPPTHTDHVRVSVQQLVNDLGTEGADELLSAIIEDAEVTLASVQAALDREIGWQGLAAGIQAHAQMFKSTEVATRWANLSGCSDVTSARTLAVTAFTGYRALCAELEQFRQHLRVLQSRTSETPP